VYENTYRKNIENIAAKEVIDRHNTITMCYSKHTTIWTPCQFP